MFEGSPFLTIAYLVVKNKVEMVLLRLNNLDGTLPAFLRLDLDFCK